PHHRGIRARLSTITPGKRWKSVPANLTENLVDYWKKTQNASNIKCSVYLSKAALRIAKCRTYKLNSVLMFSSSEIYREWLLCEEILSTDAKYWTTCNLRCHEEVVLKWIKVDRIFRC
ncbi:hypothetical protein P5673_016709, partial [Acropora cervicornis]